MSHRIFLAMFVAKYMSKLQNQKQLPTANWVEFIAGVQYFHGNVNIPKPASEVCDFQLFLITSGSTRTASNQGFRVLVFTSSQR